MPGVSKGGGGIPALAAGDSDVYLVILLPLGVFLDVVLLDGELDSALILTDLGGDVISGVGLDSVCLRSSTWVRTELVLVRVLRGVCRVCVLSVFVSDVSLFNRFVLQFESHGLLDRS